MTTHDGDSPSDPEVGPETQEIPVPRDESIAAPQDEPAHTESLSAEILHAAPQSESPQSESPHTEPLAPVWSYEPQTQPAPLIPGFAQDETYAAAPAPRQRTGPGWGALLATCGVTAVLAGGIGGVTGGWLGANDYLSFGANGYTAPSAAPAPGDGATDRPAGSIANISANALPSVVTILVSGRDGEASGSGWAFDNQGHIVTNNHVIESAATRGSIVVQTSDGQRHDATLVGRDESYDLAVLKVDSVRLNPLPLGDAADVRVGDPVIAMGAPLGLDSTVTAGIVSALNRPVSAGDGSRQSFINAIQTDAAINPGNSGGPLLNMSGQVIGVNSAIATTSNLGGQSGSIGVGFAIPSDQVSKTVEQLVRTGRAEHPIIGVLLDREYQGEGVRIMGADESDEAPIVPGGPAEEAGLQAGDIILEFEGRPMTNPDELVVAIRARNVGEQVALTVRRGSATLNVTMTLQGRTPDS